jgi:hypothetical protein
LTLKYDGESAGAGVRLNTAIEYPSSGETSFTKAFTSLAAKAGVTVPQLLYGLGLMPIAGNTYAGTVYMRNHEPERLPYRGGGFSYPSYAGLGALGLDGPRSNSDVGFGFRSALFE